MRQQINLCLCFSRKANRVIKVVDPNSSSSILVWARVQRICQADRYLLWTTSRILWGKTRLVTEAFNSLICSTGLKVSKRLTKSAFSLLAWRTRAIHARLKRLPMPSMLTSRSVATMEACMILNRSISCVRSILSRWIRALQATWTIIHCSRILNTPIWTNNSLQEMAFVISQAAEIIKLAAKTWLKVGETLSSLQVQQPKTRSKSN